MNLIYSEHFTSCSGVLTNTWAWSLIHFEIVTKSLMILVVGEHWAPRSLTPAIISTPRWPNCPLIVYISTN